MLYNHQQMRAIAKNNKINGFTIVELLIVIAIISILTVLTTISYSRIQLNSRDTSVRDAAKRFGLALQSYASDTGKTPLQTGGGYSGNGYGWVSDQVVSGSYPLAIETVLRSAGYLDADFTKNLPPNKTYGHYAVGTATLMFYACGSKYVVYYSLEAPTTTDITDFTNLKAQCNTGTTAASLETNYGMKGGYIFS
jgi:prepilin-type N-terminal cleavage/methylation domain-containing protein